MAIASKIQIGVKHELRLYRFHPALLVHQYDLILLGLLLFICITATSLFLLNSFTLVVFTSVGFIVTCLCNYGSHSIRIISKIYGTKQELFRKFLIVTLIHPIKVDPNPFSRLTACRTQPTSPKQLSSNAS